MKKLYIVLLAVVVAFTTSSCEKWLEVQPADEVTEKDLFAEGTGYRNALNGIYRQLSSSSLYGENLIWGLGEAMGQNYENYEFNGHTWYEFATFKYTSDKAKAPIARIWESAYTAIANCNNLITQVEHEPNSKFAGGERERMLILGEAYAVRGLLHLTILTYFAPAPIKASTANWIPYQDKFPTMVADYLTVDATLDRIIEDLKTGRDLVAIFDNCEEDAPNDRLGNLYYSQRLLSDNIEFRFGDLFFAFRGYRMNVTACMAILARAYNYAGEHDLAAEEAQKVIDHKISTKYTNPTPTYTFTTAAEAANDYRMSRDVIFSIASELLMANYADAIKQSAIMDLQIGSDCLDCFDSPTDYRKTVLINTTQNGWYSYPRRFTIPTLGGNAKILDICPVIRLSEMYYIQAENCAAKGDYINATAKIEAVRKARGCGPNLLEGKITDEKTFTTELLNEVRREFVEEGRTFVYYKKFNTKFTSRMKDEAFYFPLPETETVL